LKFIWGNEYDLNPFFGCQQRHFRV